MPPPPAAAAIDVRWLDATEMRAWRGFLFAHGRLLRALTDELAADHDVQLTDHEVLIHLSEADGGRLRMRSLADKLVLSRSGLTRRIDRMVESGLVRRVKCSGDGRGIEAEITKEGRALLQKVSPSHVGSVRNHFVDRFSHDELEQLATLLRRVAGDADDPNADVADTGTCGADA